jgi:hypothetical protein
MYMMYQITLKNEYSGEKKSFTRLYPQETSTIDVSQLIDAEFNHPLRVQQLPTNNIFVTKLQPFDYPQGHWYRDQVTNINTQTV